MNTINDLGIVEFCGKAIVSDPCYDREVWCMITDLAVKPGRYKTWAVQSDEKEFGIRIASLVMIHEDFTQSKLKNWETIGCAGVDSGQCGIFDDSIYPHEKDHQDFKPFYDECCSITLSETSAGILKNTKGVVSSSGYGDGSYELLAIADNDVNIALMLDYDLVKMRDVMRLLVSRQKNAK